MKLTATDRRALQALRKRMTFAELADALGTRSDGRRRTLDRRLQDMVREGLISRGFREDASTLAEYQTTARGARDLAAAVNAARRRSAPPRRDTTDATREDWGW